MNCVPLIKDRPSFACSRTCSRPAASERLRTGKSDLIDERLTFPDERQREMREGSEVAACTDGAPGRDVGDDAGVENAEEQLDGLDAGPRSPFRDRIRAEHHRGAHDLVRVRSSDPTGVAPKQPHLELFRLIVRGSTRRRTARIPC